MRWQGNRESDNVEDRRDDGGGGGGIGLPHIGIGGLVLVLLGSWFFHVNPLTVLGLLSGAGAASHIGDDALKRAAGRRVVPETFTHGTSAERVGWFKRGLARGRVEDCDTFRQSDPEAEGT